MLQNVYSSVSKIILIELCPTKTRLCTGRRLIGPNENPNQENTLLLCKGKYHCTTDLLFHMFRFSRFAHVESTTDLLVWSNPNQSNRKSAVRKVWDSNPYEHLVFTILFC